jgi:hypothetical protein
MCCLGNKEGVASSTVYNSILEFMAINSAIQSEISKDLLKAIPNAMETAIMTAGVRETGKEAIGEKAVTKLREAYVLAFKLVAHDLKIRRQMMQKTNEWIPLLFEKASPEEFLGAGQALEPTIAATRADYERFVQLVSEVKQAS